MHADACAPQGCRIDARRAVDGVCAAPAAMEESASASNSGKEAENAES